MKMNKILLTLLFTININFAIAQNTDIVVFDSDEGIKRLFESKNRADFALLSQNFQTINNIRFSGNTSAAIVMNALRANTKKVNVPENNLGLNESEIKFSQKNNLLLKNYNYKSVLEKARVPFEQVLGMEVKDTNNPKSDIVLQELFLAMRKLSDRKNFNFKTLFYVATNHSSKDNQQKVIVKNLATQGDFVIVNYNPQIIYKTQEYNNAFAPLGAYHKPSDSFLIMDVNPNNEWFWLKSDVLFKAMRDTHHSRNRGMIFIGPQETK